MALPQAGVALIAEGASEYFATMGKASDAVTKFGDSAQGNAGKLSSFEQIGIGALRAVGAAAVEFGTKAVGAIANFATDSVKKAGDFQAGMLEFQAVAGKDVDTAGLEKFKSLFIGLGRDLPVSTADVQQAAINLVKGGIDPATIAAGGLEQTIKFAAAAMDGDLAGAAETSAKIVGGWADVNATAADKAALLASGTDLLTKAANASTVDVHDLALGLYNVQGTAKTMGLSLAETTTTLAELAPNFSNANTAGTSFRNFLVRLQPSTKPATLAMQALGLYSEETGSKFFDAQGKFVGVAQASQLLQDATSGLTDAQKTQALQTIFGNDAMNAAAALANNGAQGYQNMTAALDNANGVQDNAALKQQGLNTAMENFSGSIEALQIVIGSALLPVLTDLFNNVLAPAVNVVTNLASAIFGDQEAFAALSPELQSTATFVQGVIAGVGDFIAQNQPLIDQVKANLIPILGALGLIITGTVIVALGSLLAPFAAVAAAIAAAIAIGAALYMAWNSNFLNIQTIVTSVINAVWGVISSVVAQIATFWAANGDQITTDAQTAWTQIQTIISTVLQIVQAVITGVLGFIAGFINSHGAEIQSYLTAAWNTIYSVIELTLNLISGILTATLQAINGDWSGAWETIKGMTDQFMHDIASVIENAGTLLLASINVGIDFIRDALNSLIGEGPGLGHDIINGIADGIKSAASSLAHAAAQAAKDALNAAKSALGISSPSKVFQLEVGQPSVAGIIKGLQDMQPALNATLSGLMQPSLVRPVASGAQLAGARVTNNYYGQVGNSYQMPVYTTQSAAVVQNSFALARAWSVR
jgi:TP901 family phage tail tape measure protein